MTARTCPVHGEWSEFGICRWCEKPSGADQSMITLPLMCICEKCLRGFDAPIPLTSFVCPECTDKDPILKAKAARMKTLREVYKLVDWRMNLRAPPSWRIEYADPARVVAANFDEESRLAKEHAALRWERVARRWNYKHRAAGGLDDRERAYVWRAWLNQMERQYAYLTWTPGQPP